MTALFATTELLAAGGSEHWRMARDGDDVGLELYERHYSARAYADGRERRLFVGPGEKLVLIGHDDRALFVWRRFISMDDQEGVCCSAFRNEGGVLSSTLIAEADAIADARWPGERRHFTYVAPTRIRSTNPGGGRPAGTPRGTRSRTPATGSARWRRTLAMLLPPQSDYVNHHPTTFHLWEVPDDA